jgi:hypothetical protein
MNYEGKSRITISVVCILIFVYICYLMFFEESIIDINEMKKFVKNGEVPF